MSFLSRRSVVASLAATALASPARAATDFPTRPVRLVVGFVAGGTTDILARIIADKLREYWGVAVVVENRPGADGIIATQAVAQSPADGYTLLMSTNAITITPHMKSLPYDPVKDFEPITIVGQEYHHLMVTLSLPVNTVQEFIALAKSTPKGLTFASAGPGSAPFLAMQRFMQAAGISDMVHVPFSGSLPALQSLLTGDVQAMFSSPSTSISMELAGKVRTLGVAGPARDPNMPNVPTIAESGLPGFESNTWFALMASSKVPAEVLEKIRADSIRAMHAPDLRKRILDAGSSPVGNSAEEFRKVIKDDLQTFGDIVAKMK
jgi:tripartite-type tricarboxylate transporter receptor subunit TctC